ncbi:MAG: sodium-dependent bicarbonate transport family permease [Rhizobiaceae bacterium]
MSIAQANLLSPPILFFVLGFVATYFGSHLSMPDNAAKMLAVYLMLSIGFKGGVSLAAHPFEWTLVAVFVTGIALSALMPLIGYRLLGTMTDLSIAERAAIAAHYGSISIVTFAAASDALSRLGIEYDGYMVAVAAGMETPAILAALYIFLHSKPKLATGPQDTPELRKGTLTEVFLNATVIILLGAFFIGMITGESGAKDLEPFIVAPFKGLLCLFLLDMGAIAAKGIRKGWKDMTAGLVSFAILMPMIGASLAAISAAVIGLSTGSAALLITLAASASYIAVPAAMRIAIPEARPSIYLTLALGLTFPFNLVVGIPIYISLASLITGSSH